ncbi:hypothetical protein JHS3_25560 [Jeongeupia sp. HS-3]|uniref:type IV pilus modification PilV family protein n=1 Tax=Jeongeupia sp. HS-3 TaxID=1009682 RepID=UPI0018A5115C|nr:hypothetical protein [Jeongeupia sp. HS-3]BCL76820.1 hypothetical protein JHS3_25560 [Jeongeupia sp. HS-3]
MNTRQIRYPSQQQGAALLEALVAIFIFSAGVLAVVGMQTMMTKNTSASKYRADAAFLSDELVGSMWGDVKNLNSYDTTDGGSYAARTAWIDKVAAILPNGDASVAVTNADVTITVNWQAPNEAPHKYVAATSIAR